jgi:FkbM family methyltransferase
MNPEPSLKRALKTFRASQPFNAVATSAVRGVMSLTGLRSARLGQLLTRVGTVRSRLPNGRALTLWSRGDDGVTNAVYWGGWAAYEPETTPLFFRLAARAAVTLDIGANVGYHALLAALANPAGRVYAFEPVPVAAERLRLHRELNRADNVEWVGSAVGAADGTADFYVGEGGIPVGASLSAEFVERIRREAAVRWRDEVERISVPLTTIDRFVRERGLDRVDLVKIDAESAEPQVLQGMGETLRRWRPAIICEVLAGGATAGAIEALLGPLGYNFYHLRPSGPARTATLRGYGYDDCHNYLFTHRRPEEVAAL